MAIDTYLMAVITGTDNVSVARWVIRLVIILLLYLVMIHLGKTRKFMLSCTLKESDQDFFKSDRWL